MLLGSCYWAHVMGSCYWAHVMGSCYSSTGIVYKEVEGERDMFGSIVQDVGTLNAFTGVTAIISL